MLAQMTNNITSEVSNQNRTLDNLVRGLPPVVGFSSAIRSGGVHHMLWMKLPEICSLRSLKCELFGVQGSSMGGVQIGLGAAVTRFKRVSACNFPLRMASFKRTSKST